MSATSPERLPERRLAWRRWRRPTRLQAYGIITVLSLAAYILGNVLAGGDEPLPTLFAMAGVGSCGWAWLLTRALFDPARCDARWPRVLVAVVWLTGIAMIAAGQDEGLFASAAANAYALSGSAALLMTFVEPLQGFRRTLSHGEKRFRIGFLAVYATLVTASILLLRETGEASVRSDAVKSLCAFVGMGAALGAIWFRGRHPLPIARRAAAPRHPPTSDDRKLADRILKVMCEDQLYVSPDLTVAELARRLGEPEHKVTRSITAALGFANFNRLINHHRIGRARRMLSDPALRRRPILLIAFDCGFASIGPFNRAFKAETGLTPREYRHLVV